MSAYIAHWLRLGDKLNEMQATHPRIFCVNWFQTDENGRFIWPGFGENMRVLKWMLERIQGEANGHEHLFGITPRYQDITWDGLDFNESYFQQITSIDEEAWKKELALHAELFDKLRHRLPDALPSLHSRFQAQLQTS